MNAIATSARWARTRRGPHRCAVTLIELLFVMMILGILVALSLGVLAGAAAQARVERTRAIITKLDQLIMDKWTSYETRAVRVRIPAGTTPTVAASYRLWAMRELMRMEMPNKKEDVLFGRQSQVNNNYVLQANPAVWNHYRRKAYGIYGTTPAADPNLAGWTTENEGAECLYLILSGMRDGEDSALSFFSPSEIGDMDGDGMLEILDAWGNPIWFTRWAPGYRDDIDPYVTPYLGPRPVTPQNGTIPDPFDPTGVDRRTLSDNSVFTGMYLKPLIHSFGPDKLSSLLLPSTSSPPDPSGINDPYANIDSPFPAGNPNLFSGCYGAPKDTGRSPAYSDNITNHNFAEQ
ncbi:MAG TPA: type II secretion system protein [Pirellulaceae bacterium]|nr:type II secretion system protein [Pirellulaceae bacterium]